MERAWRARDAGYDGLFFFGVKTTGIVCRPSCPSQPKRRHLEFFHKLGEAIGAGYRPCKRCRPELACGTPPEWVAKLMDRAASAEAPVRAGDLRELGVTVERARRWFQGHYGMTFAHGAAASGSRGRSRKSGGASRWMMSFWATDLSRTAVFERRLRGLLAGRRAARATAIVCRRRCWTRRWVRCSPRPAAPRCASWNLPTGAGWNAVTWKCASAAIAGGHTGRK